MAVLVVERRDPHRDPDPDPNPDPGGSPAVGRTAGELGALRGPGAPADRSSARGTGVAPPQRRGPGRRELPGSGLRIVRIWPVPGALGWPR